MLRINLTHGFHTWVEPSQVAELRDIMRRSSSPWRLRGPAGMAAGTLTLCDAVLLSTGFMKAGVSADRSAGAAGAPQMQVVAAPSIRSPTLISAKPLATSRLSPPEVAAARPASTHVAKGVDYTVISSTCADRPHKLGAPDPCAAAAHRSHGGAGVAQPNMHKAANGPLAVAAPAAKPATTPLAKAVAAKPAAAAAAATTKADAAAKAR